MSNILSGTECSRIIRKHLTDDIKVCHSISGLTPSLAVIQVGDNPASEIYIRNKRKACEECGISFRLYKFPEDASFTEVLDLISSLNADNTCHGIIVQQPIMSKYIDPNTVSGFIDKTKDVDGFHYSNVGLGWLGDESARISCTPLGIMMLLEHYKIDVSGKHCVIVGRSNTVGKPMAACMLNADATVTICHTKTRNLSEVTRTADILISAIGKPNSITADMIKEGVIIIDVGITRGSDGKIHGDVKFDEVSEKASWITPVPGGVGPMTITALMCNTLQSAFDMFYEQK